MPILNSPPHGGMWCAACVLGRRTGFHFYVPMTRSMKDFSSTSFRNLTRQPNTLRKPSTEKSNFELRGKEASQPNLPEVHVSTASRVSSSERVQLNLGTEASTKNAFLLP